MRLYVLVLLASLAAAEQPAGQPAGQPTPGQVTLAVGYLFRRLLREAAPRQLQLQDALEMTYTGGLMMTPPFTSAAHGTFDGEDHNTFSYITSLLNPDTKRATDNGAWHRQDVSDIVVSHHHGGAMKVHMVTVDGIHKEVIVGNPLKEDDAKLMIVVPKRTYFLLESLSEDDANFHSYVSVPAYEPSAAHDFSNDDMATKFPALAEHFHDLEKPGVHHRRGRHHRDDDDEDEDDHDGDHRRGGRRGLRFRRRRH